MYIRTKTFNRSTNILREPNTENPRIGFYSKNGRYINNKQAHIEEDMREGVSKILKKSMTFMKL